MIYIRVYGCTANQDDTDIIRGLINKEGYKLTENIDLAEIIIIVTCIAKSKTEAKITSKLKEIIVKYPEKKLIIAGCMPEAEYEICKKIAPNASLINSQHIKNIIEVIKNKNKVIEFLGKRNENKLNLPKITSKKEVVSVQIAEGCNSNCTYCIIRLAKGSLHSFPEEEIIKEIKIRLDQGYKRINITATDCGCYGIDIGSSLPKLLKEIIKVKGDFKIRLGMANPNFVLEFLNELIKIYKDDKMIKFLHIPLQSGSNKILKDMNRKYKVEDFKKIVKEFRKNIPNINISTDIIVGYPTESLEDFKKTLELIKEITPEVLNISKFAPRPKTKAKELKQLPTEIIKKRSIEITKEINKIRNKF